MKLRILKNSISLALVATFTWSCLPKMPETWEWGMRPRPRFGVNNLPEANDDYGKGFKAGCSASFGSLGKGLISDFTKLELNPAMLANSPDYSEGWTDGMEHCTYIFDHDVI